MNRAKITQNKSETFFMVEQEKQQFCAGVEDILHSFLNNTNFTLGVLNSKKEEKKNTLSKFMHAEIAWARSMFYVFSLLGSMHRLSRVASTLHIIRLMPL